MAGRAFARSTRGAGRSSGIRALPDEQFGEGLALVGDRLIQLTWQNGVATAWDADTFEPLTTYEYDGEGWASATMGRVS